MSWTETIKSAWKSITGKPTVYSSTGQGKQTYQENGPTSKIITDYRVEEPTVYKSNGEYKEAPSFGERFARLRQSTARLPAKYRQPSAGRYIERVGGAFAAIAPAGTLPKRTLHGGKAGRPRQSYTHYIPGIGPVHVYTWRKWLRNQLRIQRMMAMQRAVQGQRVQGQGYSQPQMQQQMEQQMQQLQPTPRIGQPVQQSFQPSPFQAQNPQVSDNILNAPNIMKGELRKVQEVQMFDNASRLGQKPEPNVYGNQYYDIDPLSGRQILKTRPTEKWFDGRAT